MPGLIAFSRRWGVGSDDLVVPGLFLFIIHLSWLVVLVTVLVVGDFAQPCATLLWIYCSAYAAILGASLFLDATLSLCALRGGILDTEPRKHVKYVIYIRLSVMMVEVCWLLLAVVWLALNYQSCPIEGVKEAILGMVVCNWVVVMTVMLTVWCVFDTAGRSWVKMKKYQRSMRESESRFQYKRSGNRARNWRQRKVLRAYQDSWDHRCRLLFCCIRNSDRSKNSFTDIARLLSDFFRDLDVVPSDVVAGLVLLRKFQKIERESNVNQRKNDTYEYLSGVPVTPRTKFLPLGDMQHYQHFQAVIHFMHYALAAYGWPMFLMTTSLVNFCKISQNISFSCLLCRSNPQVNGDNCCNCNYAALKGMLSKGQVVIVYATYHVDVAETPFFVAIDFSRNKIVVSIRGTLSMKDVITDLNAESETLPLNPPKEDWLGHKGMVHAAVYIRDKLIDENILNEAFTIAAQEKPQETFGLVLVGHSLGAGTASILAILLRQTYPDLQCFAYSPPGGLLSMPAVQYTKSFITSVVLGKDVVPRIGLYQMESLRADLINAIKRSKDPKWKTITCSVFCCGCAPMPTSAVELRADSATMQAYQLEKNAAREAAVHPSDNTIALTLHQPLYPPGSIIHVVRHHPSKTEQVLKKHDPVYQAIWANNTDFDEVLISPVMIQDHMPDKVLEALNKVITSLGPAKPQRAVNNNNNNSSGPSDIEHCHLLAGSSAATTPPAQRICLETSFTSNNHQSQKEDTESNHLPWEFISLVSPVFERRPELLHDEWMGLAPLATPESMSEVSSICSRAGSLSGLHKKRRHRAIKESHSVRFNENLNDITDFSTDVSELTGCSPDHKNNNILSRFFRRKRSKEPEREQETKSPSPPPPLPIEPIKLDESLTSTESSPLLSSLHLLTDQRFAEILGRPLTNNDSTSASSSFHSGQSLQELPATISSDSITVNAEVHQSPERRSALRSESSVGGDSLLEDIERSLNMSLSRAGSSARLSLSRTGSTAKLTEVEIDIGEPPTSSEVHPAEMLFPLLLLAVVLRLLYKWWTSVYNLWDKRGVQNVPGSTPLGSDASLTLMTKYQGHTLNEMYQKFSTPYFGIYMVRSPFLIVKNPEIISIILTKEFSHFRNRQFLKIHKNDFIFQHLFNMEDDKWKSMRGKLQPTFSSSKLRAMFPVFIKCTENLQSALIERGGKTINVKHALACHTTELTCKTLFGLEANTNCDSEVIKVGRKATDLNLLILLKVAVKLAFPEFAQNIPMKVFPTDVEKFFLNLVTEIVEYRENNNVTQHDFLDLLIQLKKRSMTGEEKKFVNGSINCQSQDMTLEVMAAQCFFLFVAGFENASSMQTYCLYELALNPEIQKTLQSEIDNSLKKHGEITYEALKEMEYLNMVISETMRKYPILPFITRICTSPLTFPEGFQVEKGDQFILPTWSLHHDPQYFPDPEKFDPERFSEQNKESIIPYTYLPFGEGPRMCFGMRFGQLQMKVGLVSILSKYNVEPTKDTQIPLKLKGRAFSTLPDGAVNLKLVCRS